MLYNNKAPNDDPQQFTFGIAFGSGVAESTAIRAKLNATAGNVRKSIVGKLIEVYKSIPKKRIIYSYFISKVTEQQIVEHNLLKEAKRDYAELRGVIKSKVDVVENEEGNVLQAQYFLAEATSDKIGKEIVDDKKTLKEEYVIGEAPNMALKYAVKYGGWDLESHNEKDGTKNTEPSVSACHFTLGKPCIQEFVDDMFFAATLVTPQRYMFIPVAAAVVYYGSTGQWDEVQTYLEIYGMAEIVIPAFANAASKTYSLVKLGAKQLKDLRIALEFNKVVNKGLSEEAIQLLFDKQLNTDIAEYFIPYEQTKNLWIKTESSGGRLTKILVGSEIDIFQRELLKAWGPTGQIWKP